MSGPKREARRRALRASIERFLADPELRRRLDATTREKVAELCSWQRVVEETLTAYETALVR